MDRRGKKKGKYQSDKKGDKKVTKNGDECSKLQNLSPHKKSAFTEAPFLLFQTFDLISANFVF